MVGLTYLILALPVALFMATWVRPPFAGAAVAVLVWSLGAVWRLNAAPAERLTAASRWLALGVSLVWLSVSGAGGIGWQQADWLKHNIVLADLIRFQWPVVYEHEQPLVYYLAYYLWPAFAGKLGGWLLAYAVLGIETWLCYFVAALWVLRLIGHRAGIGLIVFGLFSGLDVIGNLYAFGAWGHDPWWSGVQYSSPALLVIFVPQHVIIAWLGTALVLESDRLARPELAVLTGILSIAWSPFVTAGLAPFIVLTWLRRRGWRHQLMLQAVAAVTVFVPFVMFFQARADLPVLDWIGLGIFPSTLFLFMLLEWGLFAILWCVAVGRRLIQHPFVLVAMLSLAVIPFVRFGGYADFVMRSSIPALFILALGVIDSALEGLGRRDFRVAALWGALFLGALQPLGLYRQSLAHLEFNIPPMQLFPTLTGMPRITGSSDDGKQYFGRANSVFFEHLAGRPRP